jgi:hypothetical protein
MTTISASGSAHAFATHGSMSEYGGLHQTRSPPPRLR